MQNAFQWGNISISMEQNVIGFTGNVFVYPYYLLPRHLLWKNIDWNAPFSTDEYSWWRIASAGHFPIGWSHLMSLDCAILKTSIRIFPIIHLVAIGRCIFLLVEGLLITVSCSYTMWIVAFLTSWCCSRGSRWDVCSSQPTTEEVGDVAWDGVDFTPHLPSDAAPRLSRAFWRRCASPAASPAHHCAAERSWIASVKLKMETLNVVFNLIISKGSPGHQNMFCLQE